MLMLHYNFGQLLCSDPLRHSPSTPITSIAQSDKHTVLFERRALAVQTLMHIMLVAVMRASSIHLTHELTRESVNYARHSKDIEHTMCQQGGIGNQAQYLSAQRAADSAD
jgi:hypothetical protein